MSDRMALVVAGREFPCPEEMDGLRLSHWWGGAPDYLRPECVCVICIPKMCGHDTHHRTAKLAKRQGVPFRFATSVSSMRRQLVEMKLIRSAAEINAASANRMVGAAVKGVVGLLARTPQFAPKPPYIFIPTDADDLTDGEGLDRPASTPEAPVPVCDVSEPEPEKLPFEETRVETKESGSQSPCYDFYSMALTGLPVGPYVSYRDIWRESKKFQEFMVQKGPRAGKPFKPHSFEHIVRAGRRKGLVTETDKGLVIKHDSGMKLTPVSTNGHAKVPVEKPDPSLRPSSSATIVPLAVGEGVVPGNLFNVPEWDALCSKAVQHETGMKPASLASVIRGFRQDFLSECVRRYILELTGLREEGS